MPILLPPWPEEMDPEEEQGFNLYRDAHPLATLLQALDDNVEDRFNLYRDAHPLATLSRQSRRDRPQ